MKTIKMKMIQTGVYVSLCNRYGIFKEGSRWTVEYNNSIEGDFWSLKAAKEYVGIIAELNGDV